MVHGRRRHTGGSTDDTAQEVTMLRAHCPRHGRTVLVPSSGIDGIDNTSSGIVVRWHCTCGERGATRIANRRPAPIG